ncbi:hypothetical protein NDR87_31410 [Nocardia sp. CDC159]|uniref:Uncharacterized protein n=1 Tax=Nocardia pulmonis TaxID=2951408 RepID=A0A9X2EBS5_9NOCA|nr:MULTISPECIES: hypothetical protein [Nocardia]MCM6777942.1 hypothetical protein [Nocardia pulmonis]MCM6790887.1 hypothetical protein [Nocardia sp. CDC159]
MLSTSNEGHLIASHVDGGSVVLARKPEGGEVDPDEITDDVIPEVTVVRSASQAIGTNGAYVVFDGVRAENGGDWTAGKTVFDAVTVPVSGTYTITGAVHFASGTGVLAAGIVVDGRFLQGGRCPDSGGNVWPTVTVAARMPLTAGQSVQMFAYAGANMNIGSSQFFTPNVPTEMSLVMSERSG